MAINAGTNSTPRVLIPAGNYIARCYRMLHIGTVQDTINGEVKVLNKVRIGWELPGEQRVFKEGSDPEPCVISKEYTLSLGEKANLRKMLASWRGLDFTQEEAKKFDISVLIGVPCMLNIIHKPSKTDPTKIYEEIGSVSPMPKGVPCPPQINASQILDYENFNWDLFNSLPDFIKNPIKTSLEYAALTHPVERTISDNINASETQEAQEDDLPF